MPIANVKVTLAGIELQVNANGVVAHKLQIQDDGMPFYSRQAIAATRESDDSIGFDITMLTGKRIRIYYGEGTPAPIPQNNEDSLNQIYRKVLLKSFDISGTGLTLPEASTLFTTYKQNQEIWGKRARTLAMLNDPDITKTKRNALISDLEGLTWNTMSLSLMASSYDVIFGEGQTCTFTNWVVSNYTDFSFNLVQRELLT